ncbi:MAG TPA: STAS domain-containing protein [Candidatus Anammoximicrobium sp.]|nr:STAS domain-containing protein [Candidatus Anammoximicrobium sp.]
MELFIKSRQDGLSLVEVLGDVSQRQLAAGHQPLRDLLGADCYSSQVLLDLHAVQAIDSSGIAWLLACQKEFRTKGGTLVLHSLSPAARDVMKILNMQLVFKIAEDEAAARRLVAKGNP